MNEVVSRIRKETKAKLKEVVKEATRRLDGDTERMFEQALHTIVKHYDSVSGSAPSAADNGNAASHGKGKSSRTSKKGLTLNKDGSTRKARAAASAIISADAPRAAADAPAAKPRGRKPTTTKAPTIGAKRGPKPATSATPTRGPKPGTPATGAKRGPKPRVQATPAPEANGIMSSADSASTGEISA